MKRKIFAVVAINLNRAIGYKGKLPWPEMECDYVRLMDLAQDKPAIMGRLSYESPDRFLSNNQNVIITSSKIPNLPKNCITVSTTQEALAHYKDESSICILGGQKVFETMMPHITHIYITQIHSKTRGDRYFPKLSEKEWKLVNKTSFKASNGNPLDYDFLDYQRKKALS